MSWNHISSGYFCVWSHQTNFKIFCQYFKFLSTLPNPHKIYLVNLHSSIVKAYQFKLVNPVIFTLILHTKNMVSADFGYTFLSFRTQNTLKAKTSKLAHSTNHPNFTRITQLALSLSTSTFLKNLTVIDACFQLHQLCILYKY